MKNHYMPKPLFISERFKFNKRNQDETENINAFEVELRRLATHCKFGAFLKEALCDRLVCGLRRAEEIQKRLLSQADLDFEQANTNFNGDGDGCKRHPVFRGQQDSLHRKSTWCHVQGKTAD